MLSNDVINIIIKYCNFSYCDYIVLNNLKCNEIVTQYNLFKCSKHHNMLIKNHDDKMIYYKNLPKTILNLKNSDIQFYKKILFEQLYKNFDINDHFSEFEYFLNYSNNSTSPRSFTEIS